MDLLREAGLLEAVEAQQFIQKCGAVFLRGNETCNFDFSSQFTAGWKYTFQVPRADFDKTLADAVAARGVEILYQHGVTAVNFSPMHAATTIEKPGGDQFEVLLEAVGGRHEDIQHPIARRFGLQRLRSRAAEVVEIGRAVEISRTRSIVHAHHRRLAAG